MGTSNNTSLSPKRAFLWCKLELRISSGSGDIKFQVASNENLKMRQNRATLMPRKGASRRKTQNQSLGSALVVETMKTRNWGLPQFSRLFRQRGPLTSTKFNQKLKRTKTFCRTFTDCFAKDEGKKRIRLF